MLRLITSNGLEIALEEPCPSCSGTGIITRGGGMLTGLCKECRGSKRCLTDNARAILELVAKYAQVKSASSD